MWAPTCDYVASPLILINYSDLISLYRLTKVFFLQPAERSLQFIVEAFLNVPHSSGRRNISSENLWMGSGAGLTISTLPHAGQHLPHVHGIWVTDQPRRDQPPTCVWQSLPGTLCTSPHMTRGGAVCQDEWRVWNKLNLNSSSGVSKEASGAPYRQGLQILKLFFLAASPTNYTWVEWAAVKKGTQSKWVITVIINSAHTALTPLYKLTDWFLKILG